MKSSQLYPVNCVFYKLRILLIFVRSKLMGTDMVRHGAKAVQTEFGLAFEAMKAIKRALDPNNIMNPAKLV